MGVKVCHYSRRLQDQATVLYLLHGGEESVLICLTFGKEESVYLRELLTVNKAINCEELVK